ncbi:hypothetical protein [Oenococcus oeni]|uniref:hypothetical protein n=1 Tax=Oenococcus oeni TaxID=1247 RepID=UPI00031E6FCD|nr:hypothetical protein [Oenococcus oeni]
MSLTNLEEIDFIIAMQKRAVKYHFNFYAYIDEETGKVVNNTGQIIDLYKVVKQINN